MEEEDHLELDLSPVLDANGIRLYQSLIGDLQWAVTLGRFDIFIGVTTMSGFRVTPREGHLGRLKRMLNIDRFTGCSCTGVYGILIL